MRIRVDEDDESMAGCSDSALQRARLPMDFLANRSHPRISCRDLLHFRGGIVTRTIIDHDNLELALVVRFQKRLQRCRDDLAFIVSSDDDASGLGKSARQRSTKAIGEKASNK